MNMLTSTNAIMPIPNDYYFNFQTFLKGTRIVPVINIMITESRIPSANTFQIESFPYYWHHTGTGLQLLPVNNYHFRLGCFWVTRQLAGQIASF